MFGTKSRIEIIHRYFKKHEKQLMPIFLIGGFIIDAITLNRVDQWFDNLVILLYLLLTATCISLVYAKETVVEKIPFHSRFRNFLPPLMQFAFGGLFSALIIFYSKSTSLFTSGPFLIALIILFIGNEFFHNRYPKLIFQVAIFYITLLSYSLLITPVIFRHINTFIFFLGSFISLVVIYGFFKILFKLLPQNLLDHKRYIQMIVGFIFIGFYILYFTNIIPPIPLGLKDSGIYHSITRTSAGEYHVISEKPKWYEFYRSQSKTFHKSAGEPIYAFSAVFIPSNINITVYHEWSYFDDNSISWESIGRFPIEMNGGRDGGYRGFSYVRDIKPGKWRVEVETKRGQVIGQIHFNLEEKEDELKLVRKIY